MTSVRWGHTTKLLVGAALLILMGLLIYNLRAILAWLVLAALLAYILAPLVGWLSTHLHMPRWLTVLLLYLAGLGLLATAPAIFIPTVVDSITDFVANLDVIVNDLVNWLEETEQITILGRSVSLPSIELPTFDLERVVNLVRQAISPVAGGFFSFLLAFGSVVASLVFIAIVAFYLMVDAERVKPALVRLAPPSHREEATKLLEQINRTWNAFLRGQLLLSLSVGVLTWLAMSIAGVRFSIVLGIIAGILELVPSIGPFLSAVPAVLLTLFQGATNIPFSNFWAAVTVAGVYFLIQQLENNILVPSILGASLDLHPLAILVGVLAGATLWGFLGALLAAPIVATVRELLRYVYRKMLDMEPFPTAPPFAEQVTLRGVRAILFDLDGTLLAVEESTIEQLAERLRSIPLLSALYDDKRMARRVIASSRGPLNVLSDLANGVGLDGRFPSWEEWLHRLYGGREPPRYAPIAGVVPFVQTFSQLYDLGIVTRWDREDTNEVIERFGLQGHFKAIVTREDARRHKPNAESIQRAAEELGYAPEQCIFIGDTALDIRAGKEAGALTVGVLSGLGQRSELERFEPDLILDTPPQLTQHLPEGEDRPDSA